MRTLENADRTHLPSQRAPKRPLLRVVFAAAVGLGLAWAPGCASSGKRTDIKPEAQLLGIELRGDTETERYDLNGDGRPDLFRIYLLKGPRDQPEKRTRILARQDLDLNFDDSIDVRRTFNEEGVVVREDMDLDFDGKFDAVDHYSNGVLFRRDMAFNFEAKPSIVKYYNNNQLVRKERDTRGDGLMDTFEYYDEGRLVRVGIDRDGDQVPDVYTENMTPAPGSTTADPKPPSDGKPAGDNKPSTDANPAKATDK